MIKYDVYYRSVPDGRAPESVRLSEYRRAGQVVASGKRDLQSRLALEPDLFSKFVGESRRLGVGDVVVEHGSVEQAFIYTPTGAWATVLILKE